ncbi:MAG TPA: DUF397 domain-containing protein [Actinophytocola sp.]|uniref:DUF397 domain-containing protein n=1 Tax=Actinophytocola sp. TaxID=1872138 RepID=UPI002E0859A8|nr:DUF397 domain-containing protein [Actinophytocola sp.]
MEGYEPATVFPGGAWAAATFCGPNGGNCVEVNLGVRGRVGLRDGKAAGGPVLVFAGEEWDAFLGAARSGRCDRALPP